MKNYEIKELMMKKRVRMYEIAEAMNISESTLYRLMRKELSSVEKEKIIEIINKLSKKF